MKIVMKSWEREKNSPTLHKMRETGGGKKPPQEGSFMQSGQKKGVAARLAGGGAVGAANGVFGGGGGMIAVPLLERIEGRGTAAAHATAIACILPASCVSAVVYFLAGFLSWELLLPVALGVALGGALGARLLPLIPPRALDLAFSALMLLAGVKAVAAWRF